MNELIFLFPKLNFRIVDYGTWFDGNHFRRHVILLVVGFFDGSILIEHVF